MKTYQFQLATGSQEVADYFALRRSIFAEEQQLFQGDDVDEIDKIAYPIVAISQGERSAIATDIDKVVGVVRIYEVEPGIWYGGRLGTHPDYRRGWQIGKGLIYKAVTTANTWGCKQFLATVQLQNVRFFQRLHWETTEEIVICDRPHHLMEADLNFYPPSAEPRPVLSLQEVSCNSVRLTSPPTPLLRGEGSRTPPFPTREGGLGGLGRLYPNSIEAS
jgi:putative N-acetyltransferase (TIGR04045 family)